MKKLTRDEILQIKELKKQEKPRKEIAQIMKISESTVSYWTKRMREEGIAVPRGAKGGPKPIKL